MSKEPHSTSLSGSPRGVRLALLSSGLVFMAVLGAWSVMGIIGVFQHGNSLRAALLAVVALLLLLLSMRAIALNWRAMDPMAERPGAPTDGSDQTGNWGVGGPSMREPGSTGAWPVRDVDRRYEDGDD